MAISSLISCKNNSKYCTIQAVGILINFFVLGFVMIEIMKQKKPRIYTMRFASVYPLYVAKAEKKGRTKAEVDEIVKWLTGYSQEGLEKELENQTDFETLFAKAPKMNPSRKLITGVVCAVRVEDIKDSIMQEVRYLDKLIDELAKGKAIEKILRKE